MYEYIKSLHLIFVITWFAGLFYIPRLFVYHIEALGRSSPQKEIIADQLKLMTKRLWYIITWPSAILACGLALVLVILMPIWLEQAWMQIKLGFVLLLVAYHLKCHQLYLKLQNNHCKWSSNRMRLWNEGTTIILFAIVFLVILKDEVNWIFGLLSLLGLSLIVFLGFKAYKTIRKA